MTVTWGKAASIWWNYTWRASLYGLLLALVLGVAAGIVTAASGSAAIGGIVGAIVGMFAAFPATILAMKHTLSSHAHDLLAPSEPDPMKESAVSRIPALAAARLADGHEQGNQEAEFGRRR